MRLATADGGFINVSKRSWPLAGLDTPRRWSQAAAFINLTGTSTDAMRLATYTRMYRENPWVYAAIRALSMGISRQPVHVYQLDSSGQRERVRGDLPTRARTISPGAQLDNLFKRPTNGVGPRRRMRLTATDYLIFGNALWTLDRDDRGVSGMSHVPWRRVTVVEGDQVPVLYYEVAGTKGGVRQFAPEDVIHFSASDDPDAPIGMSPIASLKYTLALHEAIYRHLVAFFENQARPSGNIKLGGGANKETLEFIRDQVRELYSAPENAGKVMVTTGDFQPITAGADQSQIIELAKQSREEIAAVFHIPPPVLGILDKAIKSNVKELREQYVRDSVGALTPFFEDDFMGQLIPQSPLWAPFFCEFDASEALRPDPEAQADMMDKLSTTMTTNERRRAMNLPDLPFEEADTVVVPPGASLLGLQPAAPAVPAVPEQGAAAAPDAAPADGQDQAAETGQ